MDIAIRSATLADVPGLTALVERSVQELSRGYYGEDQVRSALRFAFGIDTALVRSGTYFVVERAGRAVACGGWSPRGALYGTDQRRMHEAAKLDPARDAARIRAFFVDPAHARQGLGRRLLEHCAAAAATAGFLRLELVATLPGVPLYLACGFTVLARFVDRLPDGVELEFVHMRREPGRCATVAP